MLHTRYTVAAIAIALVTVSSSDPLAQPAAERQVRDGSRALEFAAAMSAHHLCAGLWVVGRDYQRSADQIIAEDMAPFPNLGWQDSFEYQVNQDRRTTTVSAPHAVPRSARYTGDQGCVILPTGETDVHFTPVALTRGTPDPTTREWPMGDRDARGTFAEVQQTGVEAALDWAMAQPQNTRAIVAVYNGRIIGERYAPGFTKDTPQLSWSEGKSLTATLIGLLVQQGHLNIEDPAPVPAWQHDDDPRRTIRLKDLLQMSSGLDFTNLGLTGATAFSETNEHMRVYFDGLDVFAHVLGQPTGIRPGSQWRYRNSDPLTLGWIIKETVEANGEEYLRFPQRALFDRIGAHSPVLETDPYGHFILSGYDYLSARDWARFGLLYLWEGLWLGERILPNDWAEFVSTPAPGDGGDGYGGLFWLNRGGAMDRVPPDAYWASGLMGQTTMIIPSRDLVVVRLGPSPGNTRPYLNGLVGRLLDAINN